MKSEISPWISRWLLAGIVMVFFQILLGGITRLTGSGLSITKWEIVTGTLPPVNDDSWNEEFDKYKLTPQYQKINAGMSLSDFKFIFFWEYFHRLWARLIGFVFVLPLCVFLLRGMVSKGLLKKLGILFVLGVSVASMGWIMVASGLINRPWVNAYKLSLHLGLAIIVWSYLLWIYLSVSDLQERRSNRSSLFFYLVLFCFVQVLLGGVMSGMKAGLLYPTWPKMGNEWFPSVLLEKDNWSLDHFVQYDKYVTLAALTQFVHRTVAYVLALLIFYVFFRKVNKSIYVGLSVSATYSPVVLVLVQIVLGILTVINCTGSIPLLWGVLHQGTGVLLLGSLIITWYYSSYVDKAVSKL